MSDWFSENQGKITSIGVFLLLFTIIWFAIGPLEPNLDADPTLNLQTKELVYPSVVKMLWLFLMIAIVIISIFIAALDVKKDTIPRRMTLPKVWSYITEVERVKYHLPPVENADFKNADIFETSNPLQKIVGYPSTEFEGNQYFLMDFAEDFIKRGESTIINKTRQETTYGLNRLYTLLFKNHSDPAKFVKEAEKLGYKKEDIRRDLANKAWKNEQAEDRAYSAQVGEDE